MEKGFNVNAQDNYYKVPLHYAAENNVDSNVVEFLLSKKATIDAKNKSEWTPLHYSAKNDRLTISRLLIEKGANVNSKNDLGFTHI